ncbi:hypothetical protein [Kitasatospora sp. NPDC059571]
MDRCRGKRWEGWGCLLLAVMVLLTAGTIALALNSGGPLAPPLH